MGAVGAEGEVPQGGEAPRLVHLQCAAVLSRRKE